MSTRALEILIDEFNRLPGIGRKSAQRLAFYIMNMSDEYVERFSNALIEVKRTVKRCIVCGNFSEKEKCEICDDEERDMNIICIVEEAKDIIALEKTKTFKGLYHVLNGKISPLNGVGIEDLNIKTLLKRLEDERLKEVILALNPDIEGETTSLYMSRLLKPLGIKVTKIASGIPMGGNIEFTDIATIAKSLEGRKELD